MLMVFGLLGMSVMAESIGNGAVSTTSDEVSIPKGITVFNYTGATAQANTVYGPVVTYKYKVEAADTKYGTADAYTVSDAAGHTVTVRPGVADGVVFKDGVDTVVFNNDVAAITNADSGVQIEKSVTLKLDLTKFKSAGVYRYKITDVTTDAVLTAAGMSRINDYNKVRYLDVYIRNSTDPATGDDILVPGGYVLSTENSHVTGLTEKSGGYDDSSDTLDEFPPDPGDPTQTIVPDPNGSTKGAYYTDKFYTYNVVVTKTVTGGVGDKDNQFPFDIAATDTNNHLIASYMKSTDTALTTVGSMTFALDSAAGASLAHTESYTVYGLSALATVQATETNNLPEKYRVTVTADATIVDQEETVSSATQTTGTLNVSDYSVFTTKPTGTNNEIGFENNLEDISPTGVILRIIPYIFLTGLAVFFFLVMKRAKEEEDRKAKV